jgi:hypothetical protein
MEDRITLHHGENRTVPHGGNPPPTMEAVAKSGFVSLFGVRRSSQLAIEPRGKDLHLTAWIYTMRMVVASRMHVKYVGCVTSASNRM